MARNLNRFGKRWRRGTVDRFGAIALTLRWVALVSVFAATGLAVAQDEPLTEDAFFEKASGKWCRADMRPASRFEIVLPGGSDGKLSAILTTPMLIVETEADFVSFDVFDDNQAVVSFSGISKNIRAADGSEFLADFEEEYFFDKEFRRMSSFTRGGREAIYFRCDDEETEAEPEEEAEETPEGTLEETLEETPEKTPEEAGRTGAGPAARGTFGPGKPVLAPGRQSPQIAPRVRGPAYSA